MKTAFLCCMAATVPFLVGCLSPSRHSALPTPELPSQWLATSASPSAAADPDTATATGSTASPPELSVVSVSSDEPNMNRWWQTFGDASLDALIEQARANNADLAIAAIRVRRARLEAELVGAKAGAQASVTATANATHRFEGRGIDSLTSANGAVSYELDLWGRLAAQRDEAAWQAQASEADREAAELALIATTARLYWQIGSLNESISLGQAAVADIGRTLAIAEARLTAGAASGLDVARARQQLAEVRAEQRERLQRRESKRNALALLLGGPPERRSTEPFDVRSAAVPQVKPQVPALALAHRPDLRAAELRLRARWAHVDFTRAGIYPTFSLTSELGTSSDALIRMLQNPVASIGVALALPFVQWNTVRLNAALAESDSDQASIEFRQTLFRALADVENALADKQQLDEQAAQRERSRTEAGIAAALARTRFELGATDAAPVIDAQKIERAAARAELENRLARLENRIDLFLALGGT
jgi:NodT family efflux transporter outer membrane factor (OMF) lipoprotein